MPLCPECELKIESDATLCPWCGWRKVEKPQPVQLEVAKAFYDREGHLLLARSNCLACGAEMIFREDRDRFECPYCGALAIVPERPKALGAPATQQESASKKEEPLDDWDYSRPLTELPTRVIPFQIDDKQATERIRDILDVQKLYSWWRPRKSLKVPAMHREYYPAYDIHLMAKTTWSVVIPGSTELDDDFIESLASLSHWSRYSPNNNLFKVTNDTYLSGVDLTAYRNIYLPVGDDVPRLLDENGMVAFPPRSAQLPEEIADSPPDGWPRPRIGFYDAVETMRKFAVDNEYEKTLGLLPFWCQDFHCETQVNVRTGGLVYLPLWHVYFFVNRRQHTSVLNGVTGETMFSTYS